MLEPFTNFLFNYQRTNLIYPSMIKESRGTARIIFFLILFEGSYLIEIMTCSNCFNQIESERVELIPHTQVCGGCARVLNLGIKKKGHMIFGHKTGAEIQVLSAETYASQKKYWTPNGARSAVKNFSKSICS